MSWQQNLLIYLPNVLKAAKNSCLAPLVIKLLAGMGTCKKFPLFGEQEEQDRKFEDITQADVTRVSRDSCGSKCSKLANDNRKRGGGVSIIGQKVKNTGLEEKGEEESSDASDEGGAEVDEDDEEAADMAIVAALGRDSVRSCGEGDVEDGRSGGEAPTIASTGDAERLAASANLISTFQGAMESLKGVGAQKAVANLSNEIRKEHRRMRAIGRDDPNVLLALAQQRDAENARAREQRWRLEEEKKRLLTAAEINKQVKDANDQLRKRKQDLMLAESTLETKWAIKTFSLEDLGHGRSRGGGLAAQKRRFEVLDRLGRLGQGLSPPQRNDFRWWKEAWDAKMLEDHGDKWPEVFAGRVQKILDDHETGVGNAFSLFVHDETRRCFDAAPALRVP